VIQDPGGYARVAKDGKRHFVLPAEPGEYKIVGADATLTHRRKA
jgi:hypothetical protein